MQDPTTEINSIELIDVSCARVGVDGRSQEAVQGVSAIFQPRTLSVVTGNAAVERGLILRLLSLAEAPDSGDVVLGGASTRNLDSGARTDLRARRIGMVFSAPFLLPAFSAIENIAMPLFKLENMEPDDARSRAEAALAFVGLAGVEQQRGEDLNSLQQHGVSLARALAANPGVLLVEEIDSLMSGEDLRQFSGLLRQAAEQFKIAIVTTASPAFVQGAASMRLLQIENGQVGYDSALSRESMS